jgi:colicin import membrane protein
MSAALAGPFLEWRRDEDLAPAVVLALAMHVVLALALVFGVSWQSRAPEVVSVELWQPQPPPAPVVAPEPPKPAPVVEVKPEPRIEKPDIAIKEPAKPKPKPEAKPKPKPVPPKLDDRRAQQDLKEQLAREQQQLAAARESQAVRDKLARDASAARAKGLAGWVDKIRASIRGRLILPPGLKGNPECLYLVTQLPSGEVLEAKLVFSSGNLAYDEAVHRAILKSSPLPKPDNPADFVRELKLTFRPVD